MPLTAKHGDAKSSGATRLGHRRVASLLDFETAMTIADYIAFGVLIALALWAIANLRGKLLRVRGAANPLRLIAVFC